MRVVSTLFFLMLMAVWAVDLYAEIYSWEDETGLHFMDDIAKVPRKHRSELLRKANEQAAREAKVAAKKAEEEITDQEIRGQLWLACVDHIRMRYEAGNQYVIFPGEKGCRVRQIGDSYHLFGSYHSESRHRDVYYITDYDCTADRRYRVQDVKLDRKKDPLIQPNRR